MEFNKGPSDRKLNGTIKLTRDYKVRLLINKIISTLIITVIVGVGLALSFIMLKSPLLIDGQVVTPEGGELTFGDVVLVSEKGDSPLTRLLNFKDSSSLTKGKVIAGPYGVIYPKTLIVKSNEVETKTSVSLDGRSNFLEEEFIIECISGACQPGEQKIYEAGRVWGKLK